MEKEAASFWAGIKIYEDILASKPTAYSFAPLAEIYRKLGLADEALRIAQRGVALHPEFAAGQMALASSCLDKNMQAEARAALEAVVRITPENLVAQKLLAEIYQATGNATAAAACLQVVAELAPDLSRGAAVVETSPPPAVAVEEAPVMPVAAVAEELAVAGEEEILEADILELTEDLIEEESFVEEPYSPFAAAPPRPSLLAGIEGVQPAAAPRPAVPAEVFAAPGAGADQETAVVTREEVPQPPVLTATIAELYVSQGFTDKGVEVYRELLRDNPDNSAYRARYLELTGGASAGPAAASGSAVTAAAKAAESAVTGPVQGEQDQVEKLEGLLSNIRRIRECRTETH